MAYLEDYDHYPFSQCSSKRFTKPYVTRPTSEHHWNSFFYPISLFRFVNFKEFIIPLRDDGKVLWNPEILKVEASLSLITTKLFMRSKVHHLFKSASNTKALKSLKMLSKRELMRKHYKGGAPESKDQSELFISQRGVSWLGVIQILLLMIKYLKWNIP